MDVRGTRTAVRVLDYWFGLMYVGTGAEEIGLNFHTRASKAGCDQLHQDTTGILRLPAKSRHLILHARKRVIRIYMASAKHGNLGAVIRN